MTDTQRLTVVKWLAYNNYLIETAVENLYFDEDARPYYKIDNSNVYLSKVHGAN